ncbi:3-hydroxyacyl-CoA dehydrogenase family protein [Rubrobacter aplysinae]|uniref:3-hydroxyacyl-CoA dehydrogenase family protein n=1 Tax=Rubrobacter aplysinae TaxID=909625 RepID=UPI00064BB880|nr:3-hydroxyacyl-CoA dehydrogenase family protein [Rubrobacter aplysinae]
MQPNADGVSRVLVCGAGAMGSGIGAVFALAGYETTVQDIDEGMLGKAHEELRSRLDRNVEKGRMSPQQVEDAFSKLSFTTEIEEPARSADLVVEAIVEKLAVKRELFSRLDGAAPEHAILATNSSTIVSSRVADVTSRPDRVCNLHFFNPALVMECVEVVRNPETSDATVDTVVEVSRRIGKEPVILEREISGFVANRILGALTDEAVSLYESGVASFEDIDTACKKALGHPIGPFALMDLTGIDVNYYVRTARYEETGDESQKPKESIVERFERGEYGRKSGKGWYEYR